MASSVEHSLSGTSTGLSLEARDREPSSNMSENTGDNRASTCEWAGSLTPLSRDQHDITAACETLWSLCEVSGCTIYHDIGF